MMTIDELLHRLLDEGGSDLHILAGLPPAIRLHGELTPVEGSSRLTPEDTQKMVYDVLTEQQIKTFESDERSRNELDFAYSVSGLGRFRFNVHRQRGSVAVTIRALSTTIPALESLGLPPKLWEMCNVKKGLILVTGPTGSGKSTTLAAIINKINETRADHILTIEDPVEYIHNSKRSYVTQREVGESGDTLSFKNALKYALRQDPDVILVGEMRDHETIGIAITSAETGHLVFGTLHTSSAAQTIGRIIDVFPTDQQPQITIQLAQNLQAVCSQVLLPRADGDGRCLAVELMKCNSAIRSNIRQNNIDGMYQTITTGTQEGMTTMDASLLRLVQEGTITLETAKPHVRDDITWRQMQEVAPKGGGARLAAPPVSRPSEIPPAQAPPEPAVQGVPPDRKSMGKVNIPPWEQ